eukprot:1187631-Prorocentrum_minimum.AAC.4
MAGAEAMATYCTASTCRCAACFRVLGFRGLGVLAFRTYPLSIPSRTGPAFGSKLRASPVSEGARVPRNLHKGFWSIVVVGEERRLAATVPLYRCVTDCTARGGPSSPEEVSGRVFGRIDPDEEDAAQGSRRR